ncbi:hypothetical protein V5F53_07775 [Xanthobacter sp. V4C-4]|uniref:hypothetical protein n=1 Tax=Xanthobacter cornucopiae TaxID=3119924 RepID=UPI003727D3F3
MSPALKMAACLAASVALAAPAAAASRHDGTWSITTSAEDGACATNFDFKLKVRDGKVTYAGFWPVKATGGISRLGVVRMTLAHGRQRVLATGRVEGDAASGDWTSPQPKCSGSWFAKRA